MLIYWSLIRSRCRRCCPIYLQYEAEATHAPWASQSLHATLERQPPFSRLEGCNDQAALAPPYLSHLQHSTDATRAEGIEREIALAGSLNLARNYRTTARAMSCSLLFLLSHPPPLSTTHVQGSSLQRWRRVRPVPPALSQGALRLGDGLRWRLSAYVDRVPPRARRWWTPLLIVAALYLLCSGVGRRCRLRNGPGHRGTRAPSRSHRWYRRQSLAARRCLPAPYGTPSLLLAATTVTATLHKHSRCCLSCRSQRLV